MPQAIAPRTAWRFFPYFIIAGLDDLAIADVIQGAAFFNWANRLMLSLGEPALPATA